jgi:hypothetical protein
MRRRIFDKVLSVTGFVLAVFLLVLGALLMWGGTFAQNKVTAELTSQKVSFSSEASTLPPDAGALIWLILAILGLVHLRKTPETAAVFEPVRV